jgi:hypothetical protein
MRSCYYVSVNYWDQDNYPVDKACIEHGIFASLEDATQCVNRLNKSARKEWDVYRQGKKRQIADAQKRWDALYAVGLANGGRPLDYPEYDKEWEPGIGDIRYYDVGETMFYPAEKI